MLWKARKLRTLSPPQNLPGANQHNATDMAMRRQRSNTRQPAQQSSISSAISLYAYDTSAQGQGQPEEVLDTTIQLKGQDLKEEEIEWWRTT